MIKVVFIQNQLVCGGAEQALFDLICLMNKSQFDITVLAQYSDGEWEQKFIDAGISIVHYYEKRAEKKSWQHFLMWSVKDFLMQVSLHYEGKGAIDLLFPDGVDIIVNYSTWEKDLLPFSRKAKSVLYVHSDLSNNEGFRKCIEQIRDVLPRYDRVVCVSEKAYRSFGDFTGIRDRVVKIYNPLNSEKVRCMAQAETEIDSSVPIMCAVGRLSAEKGFARLIRIHRNLLNRGADHKLLIVGDGPERKHLEKVIEETGTGNSVILLGYKANPYPYMLNSSLLVCASFTEGLPVIAMEALALGVPVVSSAPSVGEIFGDEFCGLITENDDDSLENGLFCALTDMELYHRLKKGAQNRSAFFDGRHMVEQIEKMFIDLVKNEKK